MSLTKYSVSSIVLAALVSSVTAYCVSTRMHANEAPIAKTTAGGAFERVLAKNTLRCGYYNFPPIFVMYDEAGKKNPHGFSLDMMETIAQKTGLKVEWAEEVTFGNWPEALQAGRIDAVCTPIWPDAALGRAALFTRPLFFSTLSPLVRDEDERFSDDLTRMNADDVTFVVQDGSNLVELTKQVFPKAQILSIAAHVEGPQVVQNVVTKKADAILLDRNGLLEYNKRSDKKLRMVASEDPVKYQPFALAVSRAEPALQAFLNNAVEELYYNRTLDHLLGKWEAEPGLFARDAR